MVVLGKSGCIRAIVIVFGQWWLYSGKVVEFEQNCCIRVKVVVFVQKWLLSGKSGCIRANGLHWDKRNCVQESGCIRANVVVFGQKWLYSEKCL